MQESDVRQAADISNSNLKSVQEILQQLVKTKREVQEIMNKFREEMEYNDVM